MYETYYGLSANPFRLAPDPHFFYESPSHKRGLAYLRYGLEQGQGFVVITGVPGTGKSLLVRTLFAELSGRRRMVVSSINNTNLDADDVLRAVASSFDVHCAGSGKAALLNALERFLIQKQRQGRQVLLIVDEAQNLPENSLEELRMLSNFQHGDHPLIQIMLLGQQQLQHILADPAMEQLTQRVIASCHLKPLEPAETRGYIEHRLRCAGWRGHPAFTGEALALIHHVCHGTPRLINTFCDRLLLAAFLEERQQIDAAHIKAVVHELQSEATGAWHGGDLTKGSANISLPPLPDGHVVPADETDGITANTAAATVSEDGDAQPQESTANNIHSLSSALKGHGANSATVVPITRPSKPLSSGRVALSGRQMTALAQHPLSEQALLLDTSQEMAQGATPMAVAAPPAESEPDSTIDYSNDPLLPHTQQASDDEPPPPLVYKDPEAGGRGRLWIASAFMIFMVFGVSLFIIFESNDHTAQQADSREPEESRVADAEPVQVTPEALASAHETEDVMAIEPPAREPLQALEQIQPPVIPERAQPAPDSAPAAAIDESAASPPAPSHQPATKAMAALAVEQLTQPAPAKLPAESKVKKAVAESPAAAALKPAAPAPPKVAGPQLQTTTKETPSLVTATEVLPPPSSIQTIAAISPPPVSEPAQHTAAATQKPFITEVELQALINTFTYTYESGDLDQLIGLFADNAVADKSSGRNRIARDYRELFQATDMRRMSIAEIEWQPDGSVAQGSGDFEVTVRRRGDENPTLVKGRLTIELTKDGDHLMIRRLSHAVSR